ncbi:MAG: hypothetical protein AAF989_11990, partial [Planctomycetota bacterium]
AQRRLLELDAAKETFEKAIQVRRKHANADPEQIEAGRKLANAMMNRGLVFAALGRLDIALAAQEDAESLRKRLMQASPSNRLLQRDHAMGRFNLARLALMRGDMAVARERSTDAVDRFESLARRQATDCELWLRMIQCLMLRHELDRLSASDVEMTFSSPEPGALPDDLVKATEYLRTLSILSPSNRTYRLQLIGLLHSAVDQWLELGHLVEAKDALDLTDEQLLRRFEKSDNQPDVALLRLEQRRLRALHTLETEGPAKAAGPLRAVLRDWDEFHEARRMKAGADAIDEPKAWRALRQLDP